MYKKQNARGGAPGDQGGDGEKKNQRGRRDVDPGVDGEAGSKKEGNREKPKYHRAESCGPVDGASILESMRNNGIRCTHEDIPKNADPEATRKRFEEARNKACTCARERAVEMERMKPDAAHEKPLQMARQLCKQCNAMVVEFGGQALPEEDKRDKEKDKEKEPPKKKEAENDMTAWMWLRQQIESRLIDIPLDQYPTGPVLAQELRMFFLQQAPTGILTPSQTWLDVPPKEFNRQVQDLLTFFRARKSLEMTKAQILATKRRRKQTLLDKTRLIHSMQRKVQQLNAKTNEQPPSAT